MAKSIRTTGELRTFLANLMVGVKDGIVAADKATRVTKLAAQINESIYAEIKVARVQAELKREAAQMGDLSIGAQSADE